jgi:hypothetical protein
MVFQLWKRDLACGENDKFLAVNVDFSVWPGAAFGPRIALTRAEPEGLLL